MMFAELLYGSSPTIKAFHTQSKGTNLKDLLCLGPIAIVTILFFKLGGGSGNYTIPCMHGHMQLI
jgi:hypothetical protein